LTIAGVALCVGAGLVGASSTFFGNAGGVGALQLPSATLPG